MINSNRIEKLILAETRKAADDILSQIYGGGVALTKDFYRVTRAQCVLVSPKVPCRYHSSQITDNAFDYSDGGGSTPFGQLSMRDPRNLLWTGKDPAAQLQSVIRYLPL